jgi:hypothetical protein
MLLVPNFRFVLFGRKTHLVVLYLGLLLSVSGLALGQVQPHTARPKTPPKDQNPPAPKVNTGAPGGPNEGGAHPGDQVRGQTGQNATWSVGHPPERLRFPTNSEIQFTVSAGDKDVSDVQLAQSTLQDVTTFFQLDASQLQLCADDGKCDTKIDIPANTTKRLTIKISPAFRTPGIFTGDIALRIAGKPEAQSFKLTVYSRTEWAMLLGALVIALGLGLYFFLSVWLRRNIAVDDALFPAYQLRDALAVLRGRVNDARTMTHVPFVALTMALDQLNAQLTPQALSGHLPSVILLPWSSGTAWQDNFKAYLTPISDKAGALVVLVNSGVQSATAYWTTYPVPVTTALEQIDKIAPVVGNAAAAQTQLVPVLQALQATVNPPRALAQAPLMATLPAEAVARLFTIPPDTHTLQVRLLRNSLWMWWLVALIALASGFYSVVLQNFGFGSWADYIKCFFWGLGFSVAGTQLDQLTQTGVASNFGITVPKA